MSDNNYYRCNNAGHDHNTTTEAEACDTAAFRAQQAARRADEEAAKRRKK